MWPLGALGYTFLGISWRSEVRGQLGTVQKWKGEKQNQAMERVKKCACVYVRARMDTVIMILPTIYVPGAPHTLALLILATPFDGISVILAAEQGEAQKG